MKCIIPGSNVKIFGRAVHSLSKIGEELYIEPLEHGLALRTVNSSRSAYACFVFAPTFFLHYNDETDNEDSEEESLKCKIGVKSILTVFKSLSTLEKTVDKCKIKHDPEGSKIIFLLFCKHGIVKTYNLSYIECETLQAVFSKDLCPNILSAQTKLLCDVVTNFQTNQEEVTLIVDPENAKFKNYTDDETDPSKVVHTELTLVPEEFEAYQVGVDNEVTFCLKELRAILAFSEPTNLPISAHFESPGRPIVFALDSDPSFEANFVLATLADKDGTSQVSASQRMAQQVRQQQPQTRRITQQGSKFPRTNSKRSIKNESSRSRQNVTTGNFNREKRSSSSERLRTAADEMEVGGVEVSRVKIDDSNSHQGEGDGKSPLMHMDNTSSELRIRPNGDTVHDQNFEDEEETPCSPVIPLVTSHKQNVAKNRSLLADDSSSGEDDEDAVPGTPPAKRFKSVFMGLSQSTTASTQQSQNRKLSKSMVLAEDTDDEDG